MYTKVQHFTGLFDRSTTRRIYAQSTARASEFLHLNSCTVTSGARLLRFEPFCQNNIVELRLFRRRRIGHRLVSLQSGDNSRQVSGDDHRQVNVLQCVSMVGSCNLACKSLGLLREVFIASNYGVGWVRMHGFESKQEDAFKVIVHLSDGWFIQSRELDSFRLSCVGQGNAVFDSTTGAHTRWTPFLIEP